MRSDRVPIDDREVRHVAALARLELDAESVTRYRRQLHAVVEHMERLAELDLDSAPPTGSGPGSRRPPREDLPAGSLTVEDALANAPDAAGGYFRVPRVLRG